MHADVDAHAYDKASRMLCVLLGAKHTSNEGN
jgi:hypothetical protein